MKKIYSTLMMLAMMVAAFSFTACGSDDDNDGDGDGGNVQKTLIVDGQSYYCGEGSSVEQTNGNGMYLTVTAVEDNFQLEGHKLTMLLEPSKVSELSVGQVFEYPLVRNFHRVTHFEVNAYSWETISGDIIIKDIKEKELTIQIRNLTIKHKDTGVEHKIEGTATLHNSIYANGDWKPFS